MPVRKLKPIEERDPIAAHAMAVFDGFEEGRPLCAVRGLVRPGCMCASVIVGGVFCGSKNANCPHRKEAAR